MGRGRRSAEERLAGLPNIPGRLPEPPENLSAECQFEWRRIVSTLPAGFLTGGASVLMEALSRHVVYARMAAERLDALMKAQAPGRELVVWMRMHGSETNAIDRLCTRLRISNQSRYTASRAAVHARGASSKPWLDWGSTGSSSN